MCDISDEGWKKDIRDVSLDLSDGNGSLLISDGVEYAEHVGGVNDNVRVVVRLCLQFDSHM